MFHTPLRACARLPVVRCVTRRQLGRLLQQQVRERVRVTRRSPRLEKGLLAACEMCRRACAGRTQQHHLRDEVRDCHACRTSRRDSSAHPGAAPRQLRYGGIDVQRLKQEPRARRGGAWGARVSGTVLGHTPRVHGYNSTTAPRAHERVCEQDGRAESWPGARVLQKLRGLARACKTWQCGSAPLCCSHSLLLRLSQ